MTTDYVGSMNSHKIVTTWTSKYSFYTYKRKTINPWMGIIIIHTGNKSVNFTLVGKDVPKYCNNICIPYLIFQINWILSFFLSFDVFFLNQCTIYYTINISHDCIFHVQLLTEKHFCNDLAKIWISAPLRVCLYNCMFLYDIRHWFFFHIYMYIVKAVFLPNVICLQQDTCKFKPELNLSDLQLQIWQNVYDLDLKKKSFMT